MSEQERNTEAANDGPDSRDVATPPVGRRKTLQALGVGLVAGLTGQALLPETLDTSVPAPEAGPVEEESEPVSESASPYAVWQYHYERDGEYDGFSLASPINIVSPLENADFTEIVDVFEAAEWAARPIEYTLYAWDRTENRYRQPQWTGAQTYFGLSGRMHVRCWQLEDAASIQAHVDSPFLPKHEVESYASARNAVETLFQDAGWVVDDTRLELGNDKQPDHDGMASVVRR